MLARLFVAQGVRCLAASTRLVQGAVVNRHIPTRRFFSEQADEAVSEPVSANQNTSPLPIEEAAVPKDAEAAPKIDSAPEPTPDQNAKDKQFIENLLSSIADSSSSSADDQSQLFEDIRTLFLDPDIRQLYYSYAESLPSFYFSGADPHLPKMANEVFLTRLREERSGTPKSPPPDPLLAALHDKKRALTASNTIITPPIDDNDNNNENNNTNTSSSSSPSLRYPIPSWIVDEVNAKNQTFTTFAGERFSAADLQSNAFLRSLDAQARFPRRPRDIERAIDTFGLYPFLSPRQARSPAKRTVDRGYSLLNRHQKRTDAGVTIAFASGKRKSARARVEIREGRGDVVINGKSLLDYFPAGNYRDQVLAPLAVTLAFRRFDVMANVDGGGMTGQAEAVRLALAKAVASLEPGYAMVLQKAGLLKTDTRIVERKKPGHRKARKMQQWVKR